MEQERDWQKVGDTKASKKVVCFTCVRTGCNADSRYFNAEEEDWGQLTQLL